MASRGTAERIVGLLGLAATCHFGGLALLEESRLRFDAGGAAGVEQQGLSLSEAKRRVDAIRHDAAPRA